MKTEVSIVTAFFNLKRGEWTSSSRSNEKYLRAFEFWAGLQNKLIVYTDNEMAKEVRRIRKEKGLENKTDIIIVEDFFSLDPELYNSIKGAMEKEVSKAFHLKPQNPESNNAAYNYVMLLKWWCVCDAIKKGLTGETVAWIDFGFNNCGTFYTNPSDFSYKWMMDTCDKINLFCINEPDDTPVFEIVQKMDTYVQGCSIVAPAHLWQKFSDDVRTSMLEMNRMGFADDDQVFMLLAYRKDKEMYKLHICEWFSIFSITSDKEFTIRQKNSSTGMKAMLREIREKYLEQKAVNEYLKKQKKILLTHNVSNK